MDKIFWQVYTFFLAVCWHYSSTILISRKLAFRMTFVINDYSICLMTSLLFFFPCFSDSNYHIVLGIVIWDGNFKGCNLLLITILYQMNDYTSS